MSLLVESGGVRLCAEGTIEQLGLGGGEGESRAQLPVDCAHLRVVHEVGGHHAQDDAASRADMRARGDREGRRGDGGGESGDLAGCGGEGQEGGVEESGVARRGGEVQVRGAGVMGRVCGVSPDDGESDFRAVGVDGAEDDRQHAEAGESDLPRQAVIRPVDCRVREESDQGSAQYQLHRRPARRDAGEEAEDGEEGRRGGRGGGRRKGGTEEGRGGRSRQGREEATTGRCTPLEGVGDHRARRDEPV